MEEYTRWAGRRYSLGLWWESYAQHFLLHHAGDLAGMASKQAMLPALGHAVVVLSNEDESPARFVILLRTATHAHTHAHTRTCHRVVTITRSRVAAGNKTVSALAGISPIFPRFSRDISCSEAVSEIL